MSQTGEGGPKFFSKEGDVLAEFKRSQLDGFGMILATTKMQPIEDLQLLITRFVAGIEEYRTVNLVESL